MRKYANLIGYIILFISFVIICLTIWVKANFKVESFETILITFITPLDGTDPNLIYRGFKYCICVPLLIEVLVIIAIKFTTSMKRENNIKKLFVFISKYLNIISLLMLLLSVIFMLIQFNFPTFIKSQFDKTTIYEENYVDPRNVTFNFPEKKRNLIFIYLESMETSFYNRQEGGALETNVIPELFELSKEGLTFTDVNNQGYYVVPRADYTLGSDIATTSGVPLSSAFITNRLTNKYILTGAYTLGDVLENNGYRNIIMLGSSITYAGTNFYYSSHGNYEYKDYQYAIDKGYIPKNYKVFWGYEDKKLFEFAKKELSTISQSKQPFNFTIKTIDTHLPGYICDDCDNKHDLSYLNVLSCSSKKVNEFINWIKKQPFYENTTIVVIGDHVSMDTSISSLIDQNYTRKPYFLILNSTIPSNNTDRKFSTIDIYPTILASMGITYNSDRLGLGTNLFSNTKTLLEEMGEYFFKELNKSSDYYNNHLIINN